jgi:hypothetical protein
MKLIVRKLIDNVKQNKNGSGNTNCKTKDVDKGIQLLINNIPESDFEVIFDHWETYVVLFYFLDEPCEHQVTPLRRVDTGTL